jgi:hypothetical protein
MWQNNVDPVPCAIADALPRRKCPAELTTISRSEYERLQRSIHNAIANASRGLANTHGIFSGDNMCGPLNCMTALNGEPLYRDIAHLRRNLAPETRRRLGQLMGLHQIFALPPATEVVHGHDGPAVDVTGSLN